MMIRNPSPNEAGSSWGEKSKAVEEETGNWGKPAKSSEDDAVSWGKNENRPIPQAPPNPEMKTTGNPRTSIDQQKEPEASAWGKPEATSTINPPSTVGGSVAGGWGKPPSSDPEPSSWGKVSSSEPETGGWGKNSNLPIKPPSTEPISPEPPSSSSNWGKPPRASNPSPERASWRTTHKTQSPVTKQSEEKEGEGWSKATGGGSSGQPWSNSPRVESGAQSEKRGGWGWGGGDREDFKGSNHGEGGNRGGWNDRGGDRGEWRGRGDRGGWRGREDGGDRGGFRGRGDREGGGGYIRGGRDGDGFRGGNNNNRGGDQSGSPRPSPPIAQSSWGDKPKNASPKWEKDGGNANQGQANKSSWGGGPTNNNQSSYPQQDRWGKQPNTSPDRHTWGKPNNPSPERQSWGKSSPPEKPATLPNVTPNSAQAGWGSSSNELPTSGWAKPNTYESLQSPNNVSKEAWSKSPSALSQSTQQGFAHPFQAENLPQPSNTRDEERLSVSDPNAPKRLYKRNRD